MTDVNVRNALFDPRCGWVLVSGGVYLGITRVTGRSAAMRVLSAREIACGVRESTRKWESSSGREAGRGELRSFWARDEKLGEARRRMRRGE